MARSWFVRLYGLAVATGIAVLAIACGSSSPNRVLKSITVTPASADAVNSPNGQVQFYATGSYTGPPTPNPLWRKLPDSGSWGSSNSNIATIDQQGVAQCVSGASGTVTITAIVSSNSAHGTQMSTAVQGTAKLTCP